jgi:hypothetical protein
VTNLSSPLFVRIDVGSASVRPGTFVNVQAAAATMVPPGKVYAADPAKCVLYDAKYAVFLKLYDQQAECRALLADFR